ncbi:MAG: hypothetical protein EZS28_027012 [Streblomastix strix]|uniref:Uncharacterized protein n=1 Tax=Streblomastix strix TaxID=222440 RepID=A0A5J4V5R8_9EUKA|nr:MAG: hypothetical protein EZS28_027012 [Streblomastix strix]
MNTKYFVDISLIVDEKNATVILAALKKLIKQVNVNNIRGDGEIGVVGSVFRTITSFAQSEKGLGKIYQDLQRQARCNKCEIKQIRKRKSKKPVPQLVEKQTSPIDEALQAPLIDQTPTNKTPLRQTQHEQEKIEFRGRPKKYSSQEETIHIAAEQRSLAKQRRRIQRQEFHACANDLQLVLIRCLQKRIITNVQDLLQISYHILRFPQLYLWNDYSIFELLEMFDYDVINFQS